MPKLRSKSNPLPLSSDGANDEVLIYQPLRWQPEYNQGTPGSPVSQSPIAFSSPSGSRSSIPHSGSRSSLLSKRGSGVNLDTIPEDHFLDRGTDFRFAGGIRNPVFEMTELSSPNRGKNRRYSESDMLDRGHHRSYTRNDNSPYRQQNLGPIDTRFPVDDSSQDRRRSVYNRDMRTDLRVETKSEVSVGARSAKSARSDKSAASDKSEDTKVPSRTDRRRSETGSRTGERRPSGVPSRHSAESTRSSTSTNNNKSEPSVLTASPIEIPIEFLETPATRIKKLFGPVIMCVLVITLAGSLGAAIYFATVLKEAQEQTIDLLKARLEMSTSGVNVQILSLRQKKTLTEDYCRQMDDFYQRSSLFQNSYKKCEVDTLTNSMIKFTLYFDDEEDQATTENIVDVLKAQAKEGQDSKQVEINQLKLDLESVKVTLEKPKTEHVPVAPVAPVTTIAPTPPPLIHLPDAKPLTQDPVVTSSTTPKPPQSSKTTSHVTQSTKPSTLVTTKATSRTTTAATKGPNVCEGKSGDYFPHYRECNLYIQCHDGDSVTFACPQTTVFDILKKVCVTRTEDVVCPEKPMTTGYDWSARDPWDPCRSAKDEQYFPYPEDCNLYFQCQHNKSIVRLCPKDSIFDTVKQICMPFSPDIICYTITSSTTATQSDETSHVVTGQDTGTGSTTTLPPIVYPSRPDYSDTPCKDGVNGGLYAHPTNCSKYILCEYTNERIQSCANGLVFDPQINTCIQKRNDMECADIQPCKDLPNGPTSGPFPHPRFCNKFITCKDGQEVIQKCMHATVWNPRSNTCVPKTDSAQCPHNAT